MGGTDKMYYSPPLGIHRLRSYLQRHGIEVVACDPTIDPVPDTATFDIIGYSVLGWSVDKSVAHANALELREDQILIYGGYEATFNWSKIISLSTRREIAIGLGEMENALLHLAQTMDRSDYPGLIWVRDGEIQSHSLGVSLNAEEFADVTLNLDYESIPFERYWSKNEEKIGANFDPYETRVIRLYIKNRCSFKCDFCSSANFYEASTGSTPKVHTISPESVTDLLVRLTKSFPEVRTFFFQDDEIFVPRTFFKPFVEEIISRPELRDIEFICQGRIDAIHPTFLPLMKEAKFRTAILGLENFSQNILSELAAGKLVGYKRYTELVGQLLEYDVMPFLNIILTTPGARMEDIVENVTCILNEIERGCNVGMNLYTNNWAGSAMANRSDYEVDGFNFLPKDLRVREMIRRTDEGYQALYRDLETSYGKPNVNSSSRSVLFLLLISMQLGETAFIERCWKLLSKFNIIPGLDRPAQATVLARTIDRYFAAETEPVELVRAAKPMPLPMAQEVTT